MNQRRGTRDNHGSQQGDRQRYQNERNGRDSHQAASRSFEPIRGKMVPNDAISISKLDVRSTSRGRAVPFSSEELTCFHLDGTGQLSVGSKEFLREFKNPQIPSDLNEGFSSFIQPKEDNGKIDPILETIKQCKINLDGFKVVSFRNNFNKIMETPYSRNEWAIGVQKKNGILYFHVMKQTEQNNNNPDNDLFCYYGYKFEQCCTVSSSSPQKPTETEEGNKEEAIKEGKEEKEQIVDPNVQFCTILQAEMGKHRLLLAAEIDCYLPSTSSKKRNAEGEEVKGTERKDQSQYVELKTSKVINSGKAEYNFQRYKLLKFWIQSYLAGVPMIFCGFRDDKGILTHTEELQVDEIPKKNNRQWDYRDCIAFTNGLLDWVYDMIEENESENENDHVPFMLSFSEPYRDVYLYKVPTKSTEVEQKVEEPKVE